MNLADNLELGHDPGPRGRRYEHTVYGGRGRQT
jgi:hypothetical protein